LLERFPNPDKKRICLELYAPDAQLVFVAGSFNGWQPSPCLCKKQAGDRWMVELMLDPGRYEYRFVVDGQWTDDPLSSAYASNPFDGPKLRFSRSKSKSKSMREVLEPGVKFPAGNAW